MNGPGFIFRQRNYVDAKSGFWFVHPCIIPNMLLMWEASLGSACILCIILTGFSEDAYCCMLVVHALVTTSAGFFFFCFDVFFSFFFFFLNQSRSPDVEDVDLGCLYHSRGSCNICIRFLLPCPSSRPDRPSALAIFSLTSSRIVLIDLWLLLCRKQHKSTKISLISARACVLSSTKA